MDVSFTNVLEGARQYFQGLPAATGSSESPVYTSNVERPLNRGNGTEQNQERIATTAPYWPPQQEQQIGTPTRDKSAVDTRQTSLQTDHSRVAYGQTMHQDQAKTQAVNNYYLQENHQDHMAQQSQSYQYMRNQGRENQPSQQQPQYQSHIMRNHSYHQSSASQPVMQQQMRTPRQQEQVIPSSNSQSYHQMQPSNQSQQHAAQSYSNYQQSSRSYYPTSQPQSQPCNYNSYPVSTNQTYQQLQDVPYVHPNHSSHSQSSLQNENHYMPSKLQQSHEMKQDVALSKQTQQPPRTTHNLPPIAALSSAHYHSSRNRDVIRTTNQKNQATPTISQIPTSSASDVSQHSMRIMNMQYPVQNNYQEYVDRYQNKSLPVSQSYQYGTTTTVQTSNYSTPSVSNLAATSSASNATYQSSNHQNYHAAIAPSNQDVYRPQQVFNSHSLQQSSVQQGLPNGGVIKQKRESPLDLSVKTVRTPADSTLDDNDVHSTEGQRMGKYPAISNVSPTQVPPHNYPTCDIYANSFQRNLVSRSSHIPPTARAPKVEFLPNFNMPSLNRNPNVNNKIDNRRPTHLAYDTAPKTNYDKKMYYQQTVQHPNRQPSIPTGVHASQNVTAKRPMDGLPRMEFPPQNHNKTNYAVATHDATRKRLNDTIASAVPNKVLKVDSWRQTIDQQIEQRLSSYAKSRLQQEQDPKQVYPNKFTNQEKSKDYNATYHKQYHTLQAPQAYTTNTNPYNQMQNNHNQTYVPSVGVHPYPNYSMNGSQNQMYPGSSLQRTNSNPSLPINGRNVIGGAADKRVLSLLRNSLEIKGAKEAQKKLEQEQLRSHDVIQHRKLDMPQPPTGVTAPFQPKPGIVGRHNVSPFTATSLLERSSNTPPIYKLHLPKAIDSVRFDTDITKTAHYISDKDFDRNDDLNHVNSNTPNADLDGLAAFLAARIRTKAELKQVGTTQNIYNNNVGSQNIIDNFFKMSNKNDITPSAIVNGSGASPPKLTREQLLCPPRRRLFSRTEEGTSNIGNVPPRDKSGLRSSSETSVFDFPDTDSESEMPVLERQSLDDMRRDRKSNTKQSNDTSKTERSTSPLDPFFHDACDKFMEQLKNGAGKKRGRRKKIVEPDVIAKLETVAKGKLSNPEIKLEELTQPIKQEKVEPKLESDSDSDIPLIQCKTTSKASYNLTDPEASPHIHKKEKSGAKIKLNSSSESDSDSDSETIKSVSDKLQIKKWKDEKDKLTSEIPPKILSKLLKKPPFGDGTDFHPGWEEELYRYKRSLRMPASLIHVTRPPYWHRMSVSLPDLDPCPSSPAHSVADDFKRKVKIDAADSDVESNFSFSFTKSNYDSEEGSSSVKSVALSKPKTNNSILDRLLERYGARKRKRTKKKEENVGPKIIPKSENPLELLPTPSLELQNVSDKTKESRKSEPIIKSESVFLGFRKQTIDNFKDTFTSSNLLGINEQFATVVLKSRTRTETRALKHRATIREVFGEDRPASAPPVTYVDDTIAQQKNQVKHNSDEKMDGATDSTNIEKLKLKCPMSLRSTKQALKNKLLNRGQNKASNLLKALVSQKPICDYPENTVIKRDPDCKSETPSLDGDDHSMPSKRKIKSIRRKFSSGFDYIRKKKKQIKKDQNDPEANAKPKRKIITLKANPASVQDIQREIKMWVMNKGIGETHLHRAARMGYTDVTAYCLEKLEGTPSPKDNAGYTPLHEACSRGHLAIAKLLLLYGANVSESAQGGIRPLHEAAENGFVEIVRLLLSYGADPMLATYSGLTPLSLATDDATVALLQNHLADIQGQPAPPWNFLGPASNFDLESSGYDPIGEIPSPDPPVEDDDEEFEVSEVPLPNLYVLRGESPSDHWILLQDLSNILKIKSKDALLRQLGPNVPFTNAISTNCKGTLREMKMADFLEQAHCCQFLSAGEKINTRASKIALVKYTDKVKQLLGVERTVITSR